MPGTEPSVASSIREIAKPPGTGPKCTFAVVWMRVVPADERLFDEIGRPPKIPTMFVYDAGGALVQVYDRRVRAMPDGAELEGLLARLGA